MNYELAKQLKDAGFPNIRIGQHFDHRVGSHSDDYGGSSDTPCDCLQDRFPTLEELIEACGLKLTALWQENETTWHALFGSVIASRMFSNIHITAPTATIAVASLWLALNKK